MSDDLEIGRQVISTEAGALVALAERLDATFVDALTLLDECRGRIVVTGMGKSGIVCRKIAATLTSTGSPAQFLHPAEAIHGDLGMLLAGDVVVAISHSGETEELVRLLDPIARLGVHLIAMTGSARSTLARHARVHLDVGVAQEACPIGLAPTASTTAALAMGDALAMALHRRKGFREEDFASLHPGGRLGKRLMRADQLMHAGEAMPSVRADAPMTDAIYEMSRKRLGMTCVVDADGRLAGVLTDGDLRRWVERGHDLTRARAADGMSPSPVTIRPEQLASAALQVMESRKITSVVVCDADGRAAGVVHLHDLWQLQLL